MDKKQMERIARHYLGERLIRVEHTPDNKPPFQVVYNSGSEYHDGMYGNNVEEMCTRIAAELKSRGWVPTHERLEWTRHAPSGNYTLDMLVGGAVLNVATIMAFEQVLSHTHYYYADISARRAAVIPRRATRFDVLQTAVEHIAVWVAENLPYYLPSFPENKHGKHDR